MGIIKLAPEIVNVKMPNYLSMFSSATRLNDDQTWTSTIISLTPEVRTDPYNFAEDSYLSVGATERQLSYSTPGLSGVAIRLNPEVITRPVSKAEAAGVYQYLFEPQPLQMAEVHKIISDSHDPFYRDILVKTKPFASEDAGMLIVEQNVSSKLQIFGSASKFQSVVINGLQVKTLPGKTGSYNIGVQPVVDSEKILSPNKSQTIALIELAPILTSQSKVERMVLASQDSLDSEKILNQGSSTNNSAIILNPLIRVAKVSNTFTLVTQSNQQRSNWKMSEQSVILKDINVIKLDTPFITESGFESKLRATVFSASLVTGLVLTPDFKVAPPKKREAIQTSGKEVPMTGVVFGFTVPVRTLQQVWY